MAVKKEEPKEKKPWIEEYVSNTNTCARLIAASLKQGADLKTLIEKAKAFNQAAGKNATCLTTPSSLKAHFRFLVVHGAKLEEQEGVYRLSA